MKKLLLMVGLLVPVMAFSQSNTQGTLSLGLGWGVTLGGATVTSTFTPDTINGFAGGDVKGTGVGAKANYGVKMQYAFADQFSAGIYIRREAATYVTTYDNTDPYYGGGGGTDVTTSGLSLGAEAKYYVLNKDHINITVGPTIGYSTGKATSSARDGSLHGLNYGLGAGFNFYFGKSIGLGIDLAYSGQSLSGKPDTIDTTAYSLTNYKVTGGGLYFGLNFLVKFGGK